jgi:hypothetical protein
MNSSIGARLIITAIVTVGLITAAGAATSVSATHVANTAPHVVMSPDNNPWP